MSERTSSFAVPWGLVLPLLVAVSGAYFLWPALTTDRPPAAVVGETGIGFSDVDARLWQDPFRAVAEALPDKSPGPFYPLQRRDRREEFIRSFRERLKATRLLSPSPQDPARMLVLPVMIPGGGYAEFAEQRLRTRMAVLSGLARCGYNPEDTAHLGYFKQSVPRRRLDVVDKDVSENVDAPTDPTFEVVVPYEWFRPTTIPMNVYGSADARYAEPAYRSVLVLWLNEDLFLDRPIYRLIKFFHQIQSDVGLGPPPLSEAGYNDPFLLPAPGKKPDLSRHVRMKIIGPRTSTALRAMCWESPFWRQKPLYNLEFLCPTATAEATTLLSGWNGAPPLESDDLAIENRLNRNQGYQQIRLTRLPPSDQAICTTLIEELRNRQIDCAEDHIAIIAEWDTFFSRSLPMSFAAACKRPTKGRKYSASEILWSPNEYPTNIHPFVYLRGIDGQTAAQGGGRETDRPKASDKKDDRSYRPSDPPEGQAQIDYLRRLADRLTELDMRLRHEGKRLRAVGVLGTDVYDKLMILRALRPELNGVVFFTTDLDARYAMPKEWPVAHNLVIASGFGQQLGRFYQAGVPAFRDSQQTATYAATLTALGLIDEGLFRETVNGNTIESPRYRLPRLFEIARDGPYDLSTPIGPIRPVTERDQPTTLPALHPPRFNRIGWFDGRMAYVVGFVGAVLLLVAALIAWHVVARRTRAERWSATARRLFEDFVKGTKSAFGNTYFATTAAVAIALGLACALQAVTDGEPFSFTNGISAWPTEILNLTALIMIVYFVPRSEFARMSNNKKIEEAFGFDAANARPPSPDADKDTVNAEQVWFWHKTKTDTIGQSLKSQRFVFAVFLAVAYAAALAVLIKATGEPFSPVRGGLAHQVDRWLTWAVLLMASFYTLFVLIGTINVHRFIDALVAKQHTDYPHGAAARVFPELICAMPSLTYQDGDRRQDVIYDLSEAMDIRLIARRTKIVGRSVYYVLFVFVLLLIGRTPMFDDWDWPVGVAIAFVTTGMIAMFTAVWLRQAAEDARRESLRLLEQRRLRHLACGAKDRAAVTERLIEAVQKEREGAFAVLSQYPWLNAVLFPSGGVGIWILLEYLPQWLS